MSFKDITDSTNFNGVVRIVLIVWFLIVSGFVLVPTYQLLCWAAGAELKRQQASLPPAPPAPLTLPSIDSKSDVKAQEEQVKVYVQQVAAYMQQANAYATQVTAYKAYVEANLKSVPITTYETAVTNNPKVLIWHLPAEL